jgi:hypothetical protein
MKKQTYKKPEVVDYGNVETITQAAGAENRDSRSGPNNTAFPNV